MAGQRRQLAEKPAKGLVVTAPLVQITVGDRVLQLSEGDLVPENASQESLDHLRSIGFVTEGDAPNEPDEQ